jgi:hypothetical protein
MLLHIKLDDLRQTRWDKLLALQRDQMALLVALQAVTPGALKPRE